MHPLQLHYISQFMFMHHILVQYCDKRRMGVSMRALHIPGIPGVPGGALCPSTVEIVRMKMNGKLMKMN